MICSNISCTLTGNEGKVIAAMNLKMEKYIFFLKYNPTKILKRSGIMGTSCCSNKQVYLLRRESPNVLFLNYIRISLLVIDVHTFYMHIYVSYVYAYA